MLAFKSFYLLLHLSITGEEDPKILPPPQTKQPSVFWQITMASYFEVLIFIAATSHSATPLSSACWRLSTREADRTTSSLKSRGTILRLQSQTRSCHGCASKAALVDSTEKILTKILNLCQECEQSSHCICTRATKSSRGIWSKAFSRSTKHMRPNGKLRNHHSHPSLQKHCTRPPCDTSKACQLWQPHHSHPHMASCHWRVFFLLPQWPLQGYELAFPLISHFASSQENMFVGFRSSSGCSIHRPTRSPGWVSSWLSQPSFSVWSSLIVEGMRPVKVLLHGLPELLPHPPRPDPTHH